MEQTKNLNIEPGALHIGIARMSAYFRQQLMNYIDNYSFLEDPEGSWKELLIAEQKGMETQVRFCRQQ